jgi:hypothetical protein
MEIKKNLTDEAGYAMESLSLPIGTFHCFSPCEVNLISHSAFHAVCK